MTAGNMEDRLQAQRAWHAESHASSAWAAAGLAWRMTQTSWHIEEEMENSVTRWYPNGVNLSSQLDGAPGYEPREMKMPGRSKQWMLEFKQWCAAMAERAYALTTVHRMRAPQGNARDLFADPESYTSEASEEMLEMWAETVSAWEDRLDALEQEVGYWKVERTKYGVSAWSLVQEPGRDGPRDWLRYNETERHKQMDWLNIDSDTERVWRDKIKFKRYDPPETPAPYTQPPDRQDWPGPEPEFEDPLVVFDGGMSGISSAARSVLILHVAPISFLVISGVTVVVLRVHRVFGCFNSRLFHEASDLHEALTHP